MPSTDASDRAVKASTAAVSRRRRRLADSYDQRVPPSPRTSRPRLHALWLVPLVVALTALTSCGDQAHTSAPPQSVGGGVQARRSGPAAHLLDADTMPTAGASWSSTDTNADDFEVLGPCHLASLVDIGALGAVRRTWTADGSTPRAVQVVARFADNKSAWRANQVLDSWQADCASRVDGTVGPLRDVAVTTGVGQAYRVDQGDRATDLGVVRKGAFLSVVSVLGPAAKVPEDSAVAKAAVKRIAATF
jgi:hypothetical protein